MVLGRIFFSYCCKNQAETPIILLDYLSFGKETRHKFSPYHPTTSHLKVLFFQSRHLLLLLKTALLTVLWRLFTDTQRKAEFLGSPSSFLTYASSMRALKKEKKALLLCLLIMASLVEAISKCRLFGSN